MVYFNYLKLLTFPLNKNLIFHIFYMFYSLSLNLNFSSNSCIQSSFSTFPLHFNLFIYLCSSHKSSPHFSHPSIYLTRSTTISIYFPLTSSLQKLNNFKFPSLYYIPFLYFLSKIFTFNQNCTIFDQKNLPISNFGG